MRLWSPILSLNEGVFFVDMAISLARANPGPTSFEQVRVLGSDEPGRTKIMKGSLAADNTSQPWDALQIL